MREGGSHSGRALSESWQASACSALGRRSSRTTRLCWNCGRESLNDLHPRQITGRVWLVDKEDYGLSLQKRCGGNHGCLKAVLVRLTSMERESWEEEKRTNSSVVQLMYSV